MSNHPPHSHEPKLPADETPRQPTSDEKLRNFWIKNEKTIYLGIVVVVLIVAGISFFRNMQKSGDDQIGVDYAAANTPEKLRSFISANSGHILASAGELRLADEAYQAKNYAAAATSYDKAAANKNTPFAGRALLGAAMSKILAGQTADGENRLKQLSGDSTQANIIRAEATYHLATLASNAGRTVDATKLYEQVSVIAPGTVWAENAGYRLSVGTSTSVSAQPVVTAPAATTSGSSSLPSIQFPQ